jgi:hypothetical protein
LKHSRIEHSFAANDSDRFANKYTALHHVQPVPELQETSVHLQKTMNARLYGENSIAIAPGNATAIFRWA